MRAAKNSGRFTTRDGNRLTATQAQTVVAAALLRQLYAVVVSGQRWDPQIATHGTRQAPMEEVAA